MDFVGTGRRLAQGDIGDAARFLGIETAVLLAFIEVEAAGRGFDKRNRPKMLFEPHVFWRELGQGAARDKAAAIGVAYPRWGTAKYPADSYPRLAKALAVKEAAALRSASWGLGQILADKFALCGFASELAMVKAMMQGEREQLLAMVALMKAWAMSGMLTGKDMTDPESWAPAARKWNGSGFRKHAYHERLAKAYAKHKAGEAMVTPIDGELHRGLKGEAVRNLQTNLVALGFVFVHGIDGRFGSETERHVTSFQVQAGLLGTGRADDATLKAIAAALAALEVEAVPTTPVWEGQETLPPIPVEPLPPSDAPAQDSRAGPPLGAIIIVILAAAALAAFLFLAV